MGYDARMTVDLDRYFQRIGWTGSREPTRDVLAGLLVRHTAAIPFENLDVLLGRPPSLALEALEDKLVVRRRGGYCYEHATLFAAVLRALGRRPQFACRDVHAAGGVAAHPHVPLDR